MRPPKREPRVFVVHDVHGGPAPVKRETVALLNTSPCYGYAHRKAQRDTAQTFVYEHARVFGTGNPRSTGATGGEARVLHRRNTTAPGRL